MTSALVAEMGRQVLRDAVHRRRLALEHRWTLEFAPVLGNVAKRLAPQIARAAVARREDVVQRAGDVSAVQASLDSLTGSDLWSQWQAVLTEAHREALAEGRVDAVAWLQHLRGEVVGSLDVGFGQALDVLRSLPGTWSDLETWVGRVTHGLAYDVGNAVADGIEAGQGYDDLLGTVQGALGASDGDAVNVLNQMIATGTCDGSLGQYTDDGLSQCEILVSPGACDDCLDLESRNPWDVTEADGELPAHVNCRCAWAPLLT